MVGRAGQASVRSNEPRRRGVVAAAAVVVLGGLLAPVASVVAPTAAGAAPITSTFSYAGAPVAIPDGLDSTGNNPGPPVTASVVASGLVAPITDIDVRLDGSACSTAAGSTTVGLDHTFVGDLVISLTSPQGAVVQLTTATTGNGGNNLCQTVFDDEASTSFSSAVSTEQPFTRSWTPAFPLSDLDGLEANGTWTLTVRDVFSEDTGSIRAFSVLISTEPISATKTVTGTFEEGGTVTYTIVVTNNMATTTGDNTHDELADVLPPELTLVSASATAGTAMATIGTNTASWNGSLAPGASTTVTIDATVNAGTENETVSNQAAFYFDAFATNTNDSSTLTDDPAAAGAANPTSFEVAGIPPTVTVEQAAGQDDPTTASPISFDVTFSEPVFDFEASDVTLGGTAGATTAVVSGTGSEYTIDVSGMTGQGTVIPSIPADVVIDDAQNNNLASTSADNTVTFNHAPVAVNDSVSASEDTPLNVAAPGVLGNDTDADGANLGATVVSGPAHGTLTLDDDGGYHYMPAANFRGQDSFTYRADDGIADSGLATVTITVFPTTNVDRDQYVDGVYQVLLGRPSDFAGLAFWSGRLAGGLSRSDFTRSMEASAEGIDTQIRRSYLAILDRTPDPGGLAAWHAFLAGGGTTRALEANLAGSPEFFAGAGGTNADFVAEAYLELLGRTADSAGSTFWQNALAAGASRTAVAQAMMDSVEGLTVQITRIYLLALGRVPDLAGGTFWAPQVRFGDRRFVLAALTASDEFFALSTAG